MLGDGAAGAGAEDPDDVVGMAEGMAGGAGAPTVIREATGDGGLAGSDWIG